jgi:hypothetical protein
MQGEIVKNCYETVTVFGASTNFWISAYIAAKIWLKYGHWIFSFMATLIKMLDTGALDHSSKNWGP